jgi:hypothetical protein
MKAHPITNFERVPCQEPEALVAAILRQQRFERQWPKYRSLQNVALNLSRYALDVLPAPTSSETLLAMILSQACAAADAVSRSVTKERERAVQIAFVAHIVRHLHLILATRVRVHVGSHTIEWDPFTEPLWSLRERYPYNHLRPEAVPAFALDDDTARLYLAARIVPLSLLATLGLPIAAYLPEAA